MSNTCKNCSRNWPGGQKFFLMVEGLRKNCGRYKNSQTKYTPLLLTQLNILFNLLLRELETTAEEYKLLEQMNKLTMTKYSDMNQITENISRLDCKQHIDLYFIYSSLWHLCFRGVTDLNSKYTELLPYLEQIDQIDASVERLYLSL